MRFELKHELVAKLPRRRLEEEAQDLTTSVLASGFLVVHDTVRGGQDEVAKLTRRQKVRGELLDIVEADIESGGDDAALVETTDEVDNDLAGSMVVDDLELTNVTVLLHDLQEADDNL